MASSVAAASSPVSSTLEVPLAPIPAYRTRQFTFGVADRLREGAAAGLAEAEVLAHVAREREALARALDSDVFRTSFAEAYGRAYNALVPSAPITQQASVDATRELINNRINDARTLAVLVHDAAFVTQARALAQTPKLEQSVGLPPEKIEEMVSRFAHDPASFGVDAGIHKQQSMNGQRIGHQALHQVFAQDATVRQVLTQELHKQLPQDAARLAQDWLEARAKPAAATVEALGEQGVVYQRVMQQTAQAKAAQRAAQPKGFAAMVEAQRTQPTSEKLLLDRI